MVLFNHYWMIFSFRDFDFWNQRIRISIGAKFYRFSSIFRFWPYLGMVPSFVPYFVPHVPYVPFARHFARHFELCTPCTPFWRALSYEFLRGSGIESYSYRVFYSISIFMTLHATLHATLRYARHARHFGVHISYEFLRMSAKGSNCKLLLLLC